jgi:endo-1,4-beta-mannosidase
MQAQMAKQIYTGMFGAWAYDSADAAFQLMKNNGFQLAVVNTYHLDKAQQYGLKGIVAFSLTKDMAADDAKWQEFLNTLKSSISQYKNHPAVFAWYPVDEPELQGIPIDKIKTVKNLIKSIDQNHPIFTVMNKPELWVKYLPYFDIIAEDKYLDYATNTPEVVRESIKRLKADLKSLNMNKPVWAVIGALDLRKKVGPSSYHKPTPEEFNKMVDIALQEGAAGILVYTLAFKNFPLFSDWNLPKDDPVLWETVRKLPQYLKNR